MIQTYLKRKKGDTLRPLTEREIQEKLYGGYQSRSVLKEKTGSEVSDFTPETKELILGPEKKPRPLRPWLSKTKHFLRTLPWKQMFTFSLRALQSLAAFAGRLLSRAARGWGLSVLVVASLFLGIHTLNSFRVERMKNPPVPESLVRITRTAPLPQKVTPEKVEGVPDKPRLTEEILPPPAESQGPYAIQLATYVRETDAEKLVLEMKAAGFSAFSEPVARASGKIYYPVFLGRFTSLREAEQKLKEFRKKPISKDFSDSFIRTL